MMKHPYPSIRSRNKQTQHPLSSAQAKTWNRSDTISVLSVAFAAAAAVLAAIVAYQAETRVRKTEWREVEAVAIAVGSKVRSITNSAELAGQFMQGFIHHKVSNPKDIDQVDAYIIEFAGNPEFPELTLLPEQLAALARVDSDAAGMLAACSDRRTDVQLDSKKFIDAKPGRLSHVQLSTARIMPYRLRELSKACNGSMNALVALVPQLPKIMGPIRGTIGELMEAESTALQEKESGRHFNLHLGGNELESKRAWD